MIRLRFSQAPPGTGRSGLRIVLADDHALIREGLKLLIATEGEHEVVGEAADGASLLQLLAATAPDLLVLDLGMPGLTGLSYIRCLRERFPRLHILILTANTDMRTVEGALAAGVAGYLVKGGDLDEFFAALAALQRREAYVSPPLGTALQKGAPPPVADGVPFDALSHVQLTRRERELLVLIAGGATAREAAAQLGISPLTARKHRENLMRKLDLHGAAELAAFAVRLGLPVGEIVARPIGRDNDDLSHCYRIGPKSRFRFSVRCDRESRPRSPASQASAIADNTADVVAPNPRAERFARLGSWIAGAAFFAASTDMRPGGS